MTSMHELIGLLQRMLGDPDRRLEHVKSFQTAVWDSERLDADAAAIEVLRDLAYDLDFFEPDDRARAADPALYGHARLEAEVGSALERLRSMPDPR
jgi:hypothetical protein